MHPEGLWRLLENLCRWIFSKNLLIKFVLLSKSPKTEKHFMWLRLKIEKDVFFRFVTSVGLRKKNWESPWGIRVQMLYHGSIETPRWARSITKFIGHACVCRLSSHSWKTLSMSRSLIPEVRHTFSFLSFFISYLSGNKLRYLPQGIFKGLKQLLIL